MSHDFENNSPLNPARLAWACRRGMLELDILLNQFLKEIYPKLDESDQARFVELLRVEDTELFTWLMGKAEPDDENMKRIIGLIRDNVAKSR